MKHVTLTGSEKNHSCGSLFLARGKINKNLQEKNRPFQFPKKECIFFAQMCHFAPQTKELPTLACDSITIESSSGDLWIGCHPVPHQTLQYMEEADENRVKAPSQVSLATATQSRQEQIYP